MLIAAAKNSHAIASIIYFARTWFFADIDGAR